MYPNETSRARSGLTTNGETNSFAGMSQKSTLEFDASVASVSICLRTLCAYIFVQNICLGGVANHKTGGG
jgi:hypothetical protein